MLRLLVQGRCWPYLPLSPPKRPRALEASSKRAAITPQQLKSTRNIGIYPVHQQAQVLVSPIITRPNPTAPHSALEQQSELERSQVQVAQRLLRRRTQPHEPSPSPSFAAALPARLPSKTHKTAQIERSVTKADPCAAASVRAVRSALEREFTATHPSCPAAR
jgi:hypothetical protein